MKGDEAAHVWWEALQLSSHNLARERVLGELVLVRGMGVPLRREGWMVVRFRWGVARKGGRYSSRVTISVASAAMNSSWRAGAEIDVDK